MTDEPLIGRGFFLNCSGGLRTSDNELQYPEDLTGEVHDDGQIIAAVMWHVRQGIESLGGLGSGEFIAARIWHFGRKLEQPINQPDQCLSMFVADDDNGNIFDGTPHYDTICDAVLRHDVDGDDFDCPGAIWVDFSNAEPPHNGSQEEPYNSIFEAQDEAPIDYLMIVRDGESREIGTLSKRGKIKATGGAVRVGAP